MVKLFKSFFAFAFFFTSLHAQQNLDAAYRKDVAEVRERLIKLSTCDSVYNEIGFMALYGVFLISAEMGYQKDIGTLKAGHDNYRLTLTKIQNHIHRFGSTLKKLSDHMDYMFDKIENIPGYEKTSEGKLARAKLINYFQKHFKTDNALDLEILNSQNELAKDLESLPIEEKNKFKILNKTNEIFKKLRTRTQHVDVLDQIKTMKTIELNLLLRKAKINHYATMGGFFLLTVVWSLGADYVTDADLFGGIMFEDMALRDAGKEQMNDFAQDLVKLHGKDPALKMINDRLRQAGCWE